MHFWAEEKYEVWQLLPLRGMIATQQLAEEEEEDIKEEGQASSNTFSRYENLFFKIQIKVFLWFRKNSRIQKTSRGRSLVPCNAAGGILEYTDYVKVLLAMR